MNPDEIDVMKLTPEEHLKMRERCKELERDNILQHEHILELERINSELSGTIRRLRKLLDELFDIGRNEVVSDDEIRKRMKNLKNEITQLRKENCQVYDQRNLLADEKKQQADYILELKTELKWLREAARDTQKRTEIRESYIQELENTFARMSETAKESAEKIKALNDSIDQLRDKCSKQKEEIRCSCINASEAALKDADAKIQSANDRAANAKKEAKEAKERAERARYLERKLRDVESLNDSLMKELARRQGCQAEIREHDADIYQLDVLWYVSYMAHLFGYPLGKIMAMNQEKLVKRHPDGKFDADRSRNREEGDI